ncbi:MAG: response regulator [bacterium]
MVDDDEIHLNLTAKLLKIIGFETQEAVNGTDAVEKFREWNPHLVIMDLEMPVPEKDTTIAESIAKLPETLKLQMIDAASVADFDLLHSLIDMIGPENQEPSKLLLSLTNNFNYDYLQQVLTENKPANQSD